MGWRRQARAKFKGKRNPHAKILENPAFRQKRVEGIGRDKLSKFDKKNYIDSNGEYGYGEIED